MSRVALLVLAAPLVVGCMKKEAPATDTAMAPAAETAAAQPAAPNVAGQWDVKVMPMDKDTTLTTYVLAATSDQNGWKLTFPGRDAYDVRVLSLSNDSIVTEMGPYPSAVQKGVTVNLVHTNFKVDGNNLNGTAIAHYAKKTADSVVTLRQVGTRK